MTTTTVVKERPILFSGPMVRALLAGTKTQTRRKVKLDRWMTTAGMSLVGATRDPGMGDGEYLKVPNLADGTRHRLYCPYGSPGERLWVRETWMHLAHATELGLGSPIGYRADLDACGQIPVAGVWRSTHHYPWRPSIHLPRWASRILLELTDVRVERLREISGADCAAEGITVDVADVVERFQPAMRTVRAVNAYRSLWDDLNGSGSWSANPWVWVLSFKRVPA